MKNFKFWFCTGSQDLYGDECLEKVANHSKIIVEELNKSGAFPFEIVWKPTLITNELIRKTFNEANQDDECAGVITWMHTFSPAKSWILGLKEYNKPLCHLHTQFNEEIPYDTIDMDFMNENQSAHGGREYGHMVTRLGIERKIIVGHWQNKKVWDDLASWMYTAVGVMESSHIRVARVADNMRNVAVTEGDKVSAQMLFGWEVDAYPVNEVVDYVNDVKKADTDALVEEYYDKYNILLEGRDEKEFRQHVAVQAQIELGFEKFLVEKDYQAIVTHFGDLGGLKQLPGLAIQRLMEIRRLLRLISVSEVIRAFLFQDMICAIWKCFWSRRREPASMYIRTRRCFRRSIIRHLRNIRILRVITAMHGGARRRNLRCSTDRS